MIPAAVVSRQLVRLSILRNRPESIEAVEEAFFSSAKNETHAARMTEWILRYLEYFPVPAEIYRAASETITESDRSRPARNCPLCDGTGFQIGWELITFHRRDDGTCHKSIDPIPDAETANYIRQRVEGQTQEVYEGARPCSRCSGGHAATPPPKEERSGGLKRGTLAILPPEPPDRVH